MSDFYYEDDYYDPYQQPSEDELLQQIMGQGPMQTPGKTQQNQQTFLSSMFNILGFNPISLATGGQPEDPMASYVPPMQQWQEPLNPERELYGQTPLYGTIFQAIEAGADPQTATSAAYEALGQSPTAEQLEETAKIVGGFSSNLIEAENQRMQFEGDQQYQNQVASERASVKDASNTFSRPDGSKYKNAPLGGTDIYGTASEYDLLGQPGEEDLIAQYAKTQRPQSPSPQVSYEQKGHVQDAQRAGAVGMRNPAQGRSANAPGNPQKAPKSTGGRFSGNDLTNQYAEQMAKQVVGKRVGESKMTRVRSDANTNAMRVAAKYAQYLQRPLD